QKFLHDSGASRRGNAELYSSAVMPRFMRGIQYAVTSRMSANRLWNTGSPGQAGRRRQSRLFENRIGKCASLRRFRLHTVAELGEAIGEPQRGGAGVGGRHQR